MGSGVAKAKSQRRLNNEVDNAIVVHKKPDLAIFGEKRENIKDVRPDVELVV